MVNFSISFHAEEVFETIGTIGS